MNDALVRVIEHMLLLDRVLVAVPEDYVLNHDARDRWESFLVEHLFTPLVVPAFSVHNAGILGDIMEEARCSQEMHVDLVVIPQEAVSDYSCDFPNLLGMENDVVRRLVFSKKDHAAGLIGDGHFPITDLMEIRGALCETSPRVGGSSCMDSTESSQDRHGSRAPGFRILSREAASRENKWIFLRQDAFS